MDLRYGKGITRSDAPLLSMDRVNGYGAAVVGYKMEYLPRNW